MAPPFLKIIVILAPPFFKGGIYMRYRRSRKRCISYRSKLKGSKLKGSKFNRSKRYRRIRGGWGNTENLTALVNDFKEKINLNQSGGWGPQIQ